MKYQYRIRHDNSWSGWLSVVEGAGFNAVAWFKRREDAEKWKQEKEDEAQRLKERLTLIKTGQIKEVYFERVFNLGNYETFRLGLHASVGPGQTVEAVIEDLDAFMLKVRKEKIRKNGREA
jgi:hypothetical protein